MVFAPARMTPEELLEGYRKVNREVYSFSSILERLNYYWDIDFWKEHNTVDPVRFKYRLLFRAAAGYLAGVAQGGKVEIHRQDSAEGI